MRFVRPSLASTLEHFQYDTFIVRWNDRERGPTPTCSSP